MLSSSLCAPATPAQMDWAMYATQNQHWFCSGIDKFRGVYGAFSRGLETQIWLEKNSCVLLDRVFFFSLLWFIQLLYQDRNI